MLGFSIKFNSPVEPQEFCDMVRKSACNVDLVSGRYVVDGKSILGILSLDISKVITCNFHTDEEDDVIRAVKERFGC